jgi:hypothetical protein
MEATRLSDRRSAKFVSPRNHQHSRSVYITHLQRPMVAPLESQLYESANKLFPHTLAVDLTRKRKCRLVPHQEGSRADKMGALPPAVSAICHAASVCHEVREILSWETPQKDRIRCDTIRDVKERPTQSNRTADRAG